VTEGYSNLVGLPLAVWEREGLVAALAKAGLPAADVTSEGPLFWRFENGDVPVGFGGLEIAGEDALLRSVVTLPPMRNRGIGRSIVAALEVEARIRGCRTIWLLTPAADLFAKMGYRKCGREEVPNPLGERAPFAKLYPASAIAMMKRLN
jgi:N-acetylglutamate synthase-like GNAT family acetyltransferase